MTARPGVLSLLLGVLFALHPAGANAVVIEAEADLSIIVESAISDCVASGGVLVSDTCRFTASVCPAGWVQDRNWRAVASRSCGTHWDEGIWCRTQSKNFGNPRELRSLSRSFTNQIDNTSVSISSYFYPACQNLSNPLQFKTCTSTVIQVGCRRP